MALCVKYETAVMPGCAAPGEEAFFKLSFVEGNELSSCQRYVLIAASQDPLLIKTQ